MGARNREDCLNLERQEILYVGIGSLQVFCYCQDQTCGTAMMSPSDALSYRWLWRWRAKEGRGAVLLNQYSGGTTWNLAQRKGVDKAFKY